MKTEKNTGEIINTIAEEIAEGLGEEFPRIETQKDFQDIFRRKLGTSSAKKTGKDGPKFACPQRDPKDSPWPSLLQI